MSSEKIRSCPLCGTKASVAMLNHGSSKTYNIACGVKDDGSDACGLVLFGGKETRKSMISKWNERERTDEQ